MIWRIAGLGGAFFTVASGLAFGKEMTGGKGFIALAAMILGRWSPKGALFAALKWQATQWYARGVVELVLWQMAG